HPPRMHLPDPGATILRRRDQALPVRAEPRSENEPVVLQRTNEQPRRTGLPDTRRPSVQCHDDFAAGTELRVGHRGAMQYRRSYRLAGCSLPDASGAIRRAGEEEVATPAQMRGAHCLRLTHWP